MSSAEGRRAAFRGVLERQSATVPVSVWDAVSGRLATAMGFEVGLFGGSVASHVVLGAPDIVLLTLTELAEQTRRITRACDVPLIVDADHGYGNALNVQRTVEELDAAGAAALTIEDTVLPRRHGGPAGELISREEYRHKLLAAVSARGALGPAIIARNGGLQAGGIDEAVERVKIATDAGADAVFVLGTNELAQVQAVRGATSLPIVLNTLAAPLEELAALNVRLVFQGHLPYYATIRAVYEAYAHIRDGGAQPPLRDRAATPEQQALALDEPGFAALGREYLGQE